MNYVSKNIHHHINEDIDDLDRVILEILVSHDNLGEKTVNALNDCLSMAEPIVTRHDQVLNTYMELRYWGRVSGRLLTDLKREWFKLVDLSKGGL
jgi:predicted RecB family endonuclease